MAQASGSSAEIWYKIETTNGVTPSTDSGADTTLASAVNPGATSIEVASDTGIAAGEILKVGNDNNMEFLKVDSSYVSGTTVALDANTKLNYRHESGEAVKETDPTSDWFKLGNVRSFAPSGGRELQRSQALTGTRVLSNFREGNYDAGADMTVELDIATAGMFYFHALNSDYKTTGTTQPASPVNTTVATADIAIGDTSFDVASATDMETGIFLEIGSGEGAEMVKVGTYTSGTTIDLDPAAHPNGFRKAHVLTTSTVVEKIAPFTHEIVRGATIPEGISFLLRFADIDSLMLIRGNKFSNLSLNVDPSDLPTVDMNVVGKAFQILSENIFGTPTTIDHTPYAHWESVVKIDGSEQVSNQFESLSVVIENTIQGNFVVGSPIKGAITPGEGNVSGSFTYQFGSQQFSEKTVSGAETSLDFEWTYIGDDNHSMAISVPKAKFEGNPHPGVSSKDPITDDKSFVGRLDTSQTPNTDVKVTYKNNQPTVEYMVQSVL